jgi:hypothetical protein
MNRPDGYSSHLQLPSIASAVSRRDAGSALDGSVPPLEAKTVVAVSYPISPRSKRRFSTDSDA